MLTSQDVLSFLGVSAAVGRFLLFYVASIPCCWLHRFIHGTTLRHIFSAATGAFLSYLAFGVGANLHFAVSIMIGYAAMLFDRRRSGLITFVLAMTFLIGCHVWYMSGDAWKDGGIDFTGALMIITLKTIGAAFDYQDGLLSEADLKEAQKHNFITRLPSLLEYMGYSLNCGTHFAGPVYGIRSYLDWTSRSGVWSDKQEHPPPPPFLATARALVQAVVCMFLYIKIVPLCPLSIFTSPEYRALPAWRCWVYMYIACVATRLKYYFIWSISEAAMVMSGLGFSGWTNDEKEKEGKEGKKAVASWDRAKNCKILNVEFADSAVRFPLNWNISVSNWLRVYVYERLTPVGQKGGFKELMATQITSALWHGLYPGYLFMFVGTGLMMFGSRVIYRVQLAIPKEQKAGQLAAKVAHGFYAAFCNNYAATGFIVLFTRDTLLAYSGVYYLGTIVPVVIIILGAVFPAKKSSRGAKKGRREGGKALVEEQNGEKVVKKEF